MSGERLDSTHHNKPSYLDWDSTTAESVRIPIRHADGPRMLPDFELVTRSFTRQIGFAVSMLYPSCKLKVLLG